MPANATARLGERHFPLNGLRVATLEWPAAAVPVIALHGWLDNAASFQPLAPLLNAHLVVPDLIGHGHSAHLPQAASYHLADHCRWVIALADALGWQRFVLMGHSMGAAIASITAAAAPQRLAGLILIEGLGPLAFTPEQEVERLRELFASAPPRRDRRCFADIDSAVRLRQRLARYPIGRDAAALLTRRGMEAVNDGYRWRHDERLKGPATHYYTAEQSAGILRAIETPTLLLSASDGAFRDGERLARRKGCIRQLEHATLPGGHHLHMEAAERVAPVINAFLARLAPTGTRGFGA